MRPLLEIRDALIEFVTFSVYLENLDVYQKQEALCPRDIQHREESWKYDAQRSIFDDIRGVWIADETLSVFDTSQSKQTEVNGEVKSSKSILIRTSFNLRLLAPTFGQGLSYSPRTTSREKIVEEEYSQWDLFKGAFVWDI